MPKTLAVKGQLFPNSSPDKINNVDCNVCDDIGGEGLPEVDSYIIDKLEFTVTTEIAADF